ncbi:MAG: TatD family deoxyribonuclease [Chloroflexi bacterium]|nr:TatD family deoxyribonuclease [Chloroflexota bacterium]
MLVDTHAHLDAQAFEGDRKEVITRALTAGVNAIITVGADMESSRAAVALARQHRCVYATVGVHPHDAAQVQKEDLAELERLCADPQVVAVGEIGLDFYRNLSPAQVQKQVFLTQLELARQLNKPVVVHDRDAHAETMAILQDRALGCGGVLHCFSGDRQMAKQAIRMGFYLSFAGPITFENALKLQELAREIPLEHILVETDCPYLAPHPHRGKRNEPAYVRMVAAKIAALKEIPLERVAEATTANAERLFGLPSRHSPQPTVRSC